MLDFLTENLRAALRNVNGKLVYEMRIRANKPVVLCYGGKYVYLGPFGIAAGREGAITATVADIENIIYRASEFSVYSVTEQLRQGFLTGSGGERIGLAGVFVYENGSTFTVKDVTSLNIRVPHEVFGCAAKICKACFAEGLASVLLLSPPGKGKTTMLRDIARTISADRPINLLINDERNEISAAQRDFTLDVGPFADVIRYSYKKDALLAAVRAMRPDVVITDEIVSAEELEAVAACVRGGVEVVASAHLRDLSALCASPIFARAHEQKIFRYYVVLSGREIGKVAGIYAEDLTPLYEETE